VNSSQSRVLSITGLSHLQDIALDEETGLTERYVLLAVYDSRVKECVNSMNYYVMYPWPFAGYAREGDNNAMWWEEIMIATQIDLALETQGSKEIQDLLGLHSGGASAAYTMADTTSCPVIAFFPRKSTLSNFELWTVGDEQKSHTTDAKTQQKVPNEFRSWVWQRLKMTVSVVNRTPWTLKQWWLDGQRGVQLADIAPDQEYRSNTYLSHTFVYRPSFVEGNVLNNQVLHLLLLCIAFSCFSVWCIWSIAWHCSMISSYIFLFLHVVWFYVISSCLISSHIVIWCFVTVTSILTLTLTLALSRAQCSGTRPACKTMARRSSLARAASTITATATAGPKKVGG
jgi:hypothetical protein